MVLWTDVNSMWSSMILRWNEVAQPICLAPGPDSWRWSWLPCPIAREHCCSVVSQVFWAALFAFCRISLKVPDAQEGWRMCGCLRRVVGRSLSQVFAKNHNHRPGKLELIQMSKRHETTSNSSKALDPSNSKVRARLASAQARTCSELVNYGELFGMRQRQVARGDFDTARSTLGVARDSGGSSKPNSSKLWVLRFCSLLIFQEHEGEWSRLSFEQLLEADRRRLCQSLSL